jgi:hypothetical protein
MEECRSDRSIVQCGGAGGEIRRGGVAHALTLSRPHATHITFFNSRTQRERERERVRKNTAQYNTIQYSKVSLGPHRKWPVAWSYPSPTLLFPSSSRQSYSRLTASLAMQLSIRSLAQKQKCSRTRLQSPTTPLTSINIRRHVKKYYYD